MCEAARVDGTADFFARIPRSPVSVIHHKRARLAKFLVPHIKRGTHCKPRVPRGWMDVDLLKPGAVENFAVSDTVESHSTGQTYSLKGCVQPLQGQQAKINLLQPRLQ